MGVSNSPSSLFYFDPVCFFKQLSAIKQVTVKMIDHVLNALLEIFENI